MRRVFGTPGFARVFLGVAASMFGDSLMLIVLSMWVKTLTGSNSAAGLTFLWMTVPALLAPVLGYVVDRVPRRAFLVWANVASAAMMLPLLLVHDAGDVWILYAVAFCYGVSFVVVPAALNGLLKDMLADDVLVEANASLGLIRQGLRLVGPLVGAATFSLAGGSTVALADALTFLVAAAAIAGLRVRETAHAEPRAPQRWWAEVAEGASYIRRTPLLLHPTVALGMALLVIGFAESAAYATLDAFGQPVSFMGPLLTAQGAGAVAAGLVAGRVVKRYGEPTALLLGLLLASLGLGLVAVVDAVWELMAAVAVLGAGLPLIFVAFTTLVQRQTPSRLMGRVSASVEVLVTTPQAVGIGVGALLVSLMGYRTIFAVMCAGTLVAATYLTTALHRRLGRTPAITGERPVGPALPGTVLPEPLGVTPPGPDASTPGR